MSTAGPHHEPAGSIWIRSTFPFQIEISLLKIHRGRKGEGMGGDLVRSEADMSATSARGPGMQIVAAPSLFFDIK